MKYQVICSILIPASAYCREYKEWIIGGVFDRESLANLFAEAYNQQFDALGLEALVVKQREV